jgi:excisionase family DNA binding protein
MNNELVTTRTVEERLNDLETTARRLSVSIWTVRRWVQNGRLASVKLGARRLITESEIQRAIIEGLR